MRRTIKSGRLAIRVDADTLLAVPPMHPHTPSAVRVQVFEYVLRGQLGLAHMTAELTAEELDGIAASRARLASVMAQTPHRNARGAVAA